MIVLRRFFAFADNPWMWTSAFVLAVFLTQIGSFHKEVMDWDESTFILMASYVLDGELPYINHFDNKPPLMFYMLAGVMAVFGESLLAVRLFGDLCIVISSVAAFSIARRKVDVTAAGLGILVAIFMNASGFGQHTSTELPATAMLMTALWLMIARPDRIWAAGLIGLLISLATLTRTNLAVVAVAFGLYFLWVTVFGQDRSSARKSLFAYILAGLVPPVVFVLIYIAAGALDVLKLVTVDVALTYAGSKMNAFQALKGQMSHPIAHLVIWCTVSGALYALSGLLKSGRFARKFCREDVLVWLTFAAVVISILNTGNAYSHYLLQLIPILGIFSAYLFAAVRPVRYAFAAACGLLAVLFYQAMAVNGSATLRMFTDWEFVQKSHEIRAAAKRIDEIRAPDDAIWAMQNHLVLWYLDTMPVSKVATHPSDLVRGSVLSTLRDAGYIAGNELQRVVESRPRFLVKRSEQVPWYLQREPAVQAMIDRDYVLFHKTPKIVVYRLRKSDGS